ncbi:MAG: DUF362 domain-containing protein, partial [bacterium]
DDSIKLLTGKSEPGQAWSALFPELTSSTKIAIKVNAIEPNVPTRVELAKGIVEGLKLMTLDNGSATLSADQIYLYDQGEGTRSYKFEAAGYTAANFPGVHLINADRVGYAFDEVNGKRYDKTLYDAQYLINAPVLKGHGEYAEYFTVGFKNHFGTYTFLHRSIDKAILDGLDPDSDSSSAFMRDINCLGAIYNKTVLTVVSAIHAMREKNGPNGVADNYSTYVKAVDPQATNGTPSTIVMSTDPVTAEFQAIKIAKMRDGKPADQVLPSIMPNYLKASGGDTSSRLSTVYNIGIINPENMDAGEIINNEIKKTPNYSDVYIRRETAYQNTGLLHIKRISPNPFKNICVIYIVNHPGLLHKNIRTRFYNSAARLIKNISTTFKYGQNSFIWDGRDSSGTLLPSGAYVVKLDTGGTSASRKIYIAR